MNLSNNRDQKKRSNKLSQKPDEDVKIAWVLTNAPQWEQNITTMNEDAVLNIMRCAEEVALSSFRLENSNTRAALMRCYQRLSIFSAEVLSKMRLSPGYSLEAKLYANLECLANAKAMSEADWKNMQAYKRFLDKNPSLATLWQEKTKDVITRLEQQWLVGVTFWCQPNRDASMTPGLIQTARIRLIQTTQLLQDWSPGFNQRETTKKVFQRLWECYLEHAKTESENPFNRVGLLESILIYEQGELAERAKAFRLVRIQKDKLDIFKAQCEAELQKLRDIPKDDDSALKSSRDFARR